MNAKDVEVVSPKVRLGPVRVKAGVCEIGAKATTEKPEQPKPIPEPKPSQLHFSIQ